jgi:hypothetical protein
MDEITLFLSIVVAGFSMLLALVSFVAYFRLHATKLLLVGMAFSAFVIKGALVVIGFLNQDKLGLIIDFVILVFLYLATIKK